MEVFIEVLSALGGSVKISGIDEKLAESLNVSEELLALEDESSTSIVFSYKIRWARTELIQKGILANPSRDTWAMAVK